MSSTQSFQAVRHGRCFIPFILHSSSLCVVAFISIQLLSAHTKALEIVPTELTSKPDQYPLNQTNFSLQYRAEGEIEIKEGRDLQNTRGFNFIATVDREKWLIRTQPHVFLTNSHNAAVEYYESGTDGTNVYWLALHNKQYNRQNGQLLALARLREDEQELLKTGGNKNGLETVQSLIQNISRNLTNSVPSHKPQNQASGLIRHGTVPEFRQEDLIAALWIAVCSGSHFANLPHDLAPAIFEELSISLKGNKNCFVGGIWQLIDQIPYLPQYMRMTNNGIIFSSIPVRSQSSLFHPHGSMHKEAYTSTVYEVTDFMISSGLKMPKEFQITSYTRKSMNPGNLELIPKYMVTGKIRSVNTNISSTNFLPAISVATAIQDNRLSGQLQGVPARYFATNEIWPTVEQVQATPRFKEMELTANNRHRQKHWTTRLLRCLVYGVLLTAILVPPLLFLWRTIGKNRSPEQTKTISPYSQ